MSAILPNVSTFLLLVTLEILSGDIANIRKISIRTQCLKFCGFVSFLFEREIKSKSLIFHLLFHISNENQHPGQCAAEARNQELHPSVRQGWQESKH